MNLKIRTELLAFPGTHIYGKKGFVDPRIFFNHIFYIPYEAPIKHFGHLTLSDDNGILSFRTAEPVIELATFGAE